MNGQLSFLEKVLKNKFKGRQFWLEYDAFCKSLEEIDLDIDLFIRTIPKLVKKLENDYSLNKLYSGINTFSLNNISQANKLFEKILLNSSNDSISFIPSILGGLSKSKENLTEVIKKAKKLIESSNPNFKRVGLLAIITIEINDKKVESDFLKYCISQFDEIIANRRLEYYHLVLRNCIWLRSKFKNSDNYIIQISKENIVEVQLETAFFLSSDLKIDEEYEMFQTLLFNVIQTHIKFKGVYNSLNYTLTNICIEYSELTIDFIEKWLVFNKKRPNNIEIFGDVFLKLYMNNRIKFDRVLTDWLNKEGIVFQQSLFHICRIFSYKKITELSISSELIGRMSFADIKYITLKALGFIYEKHLIRSLIFSILKEKINDKESVLLISSVFINNLCMNYFTTIDYLKEKMKVGSKVEKRVLKTIIKESSDYYNKIYDLPLRKEFNPSEKRILYFNKIQSKQFNRDFEKSSKDKNSFMNLITNINLRTGKAWFGKFDGKYSEPMTPSLISHSAEMPRGEFIDPIGQMNLRLIWRNVKRSK